MNLRILSIAEDDLVVGFEFYEKSAPGVGSYFLNTLYGEIDSLRLYAGVHRVLLGYHRLLSARFPYAVYYTVQGDTVEVWRVLDLRRKPAWVSAQLKKTRRRRN